MASGGKDADDKMRPPRRTANGEERLGSPLPAPVEAVTGFGFPLDLVRAVYLRLLAALPPLSSFQDGAGSDVTSVPESRDARITASVLLTAVDDAIHHSSDVASNSGFAASSEYVIGDAVSSAASLMVTNHAAWTNTGDLQVDGSHDDAAASTGQSAQSERQQGDHTAASSSQPPQSQSPHLQSAATSQHSQQTSGGVTETRTTTVGQTTAAGLSAMSVPATAPTTTVSQGPSPSTAPTTTTATPAVSRAARVTTNRAEGPASNDGRTRERRRQLERLRALRAENRRLKARQTCRQCRQRPVALTFLPCGHFCFCQQCGSTFDACPVCRKTVLADVRTFVS